LLFDYPVVSKQLRDFYKYRPDCDKDCKHDHGKNDQRHHCCGFNLIEHGVGHSDLDALLKNPQPLDFIFEIVKVDQPGEYVKDLWSLSEEERIKMIPLLKEQGNELFKSKLYKEASKKYQTALGFFEQLMLKEKPNDIEWNELNEQKIPILLNFCLCKFNLGEFYECIEHTNTILDTQPNNVKAIFRRAKAYSAIWNLEEARNDFKKCKELDPSLEKEVNSQLELLKKIEEKSIKEEKEKYRGKLFG
jgi:AH receptor-interacting protein